ncbi:MAG TPA: hypothetical protein VFP61_14880 [Acidimicrobiales bacterium]|nr:hypothetical protein [Acidimicrobiales bacterium]
MRLSLTLAGLAALAVITILGARSCGPVPGTATPRQFLQTGLAGVCADATATAAAGGDSAPVTLSVPADAALGLAGGTTSCPPAAPTAP